LVRETALIPGSAHCYVKSNSNFPVSDFLFARSQMGMSLAFHIVFAAIGIGLPVLMVISEALYLRTGRPVFLELAKRWSRGAVILFAVGAAIAEVTLILIGWSLAQYPRLITPDITIFNAAAPEVTLRLLTYALVVGAIVLFPSLFFLFRVFKGKES
jgi:cytochrome bd-type quinol oxidase subunit 2